MLKHSRNLVLDIFNCANEKVCSIYDNTRLTSGEATDVIVVSQRNGWKELSFNIPSKCSTEEGLKDNPRLQYLIADYRIRLIDDYGTDWYIISDLKISHNNFSKKVSVVAGHVSQILKNKNLNLLFSDEEGNNVGTCEQLIETILKGTGWSKGIIDTFYEKYGYKTAGATKVLKVRSLTASSRTGAFALIEKVCELFLAKAVFHGDTKTVDILPMNPFSEPEDGGLPDLSKADGILELDYSKNIKNLQRQLNTLNIVNSLYLYGNYGDSEDSLNCNIQLVTHKEAHITTNVNLVENRKYFCLIVDTLGKTTKITFTVTLKVTSGTVLIWSMFDPASRSYIWNSTTKKAYKVIVGTGGTSFSKTINYVYAKNWLTHVMDFTYYQNNNMLTDAALQTIATYQCGASAYYENINQKAVEYANALTDLSEDIGSINYMKMAPATSPYSSSSGYLRITFDTTTYDHGIIYRTDDYLRKNKQFKFVTTDGLKDSGDPINTAASMVYLIKNTGEYKKTYLRALQAEEYPTYVDTWYPFTSGLFDSNWKIFILSSNNVNGILGSLQALDEAADLSVEKETKVVTTKHYLYFNPKTDPTVLASIEYAWMCKTNAALTNFDLYYYNTSLGDGSWHKVFFGMSPTATASDGNYKFDQKTVTLYKANESNQWEKISTDGKDVKVHSGLPWKIEERILSNFSVVINTCYNKMKYHVGEYATTVYNVLANSLPKRYYIRNDFSEYYLFDTNEYKNATTLIPGTHTLSYDCKKKLLTIKSTSSTDEVVESKIIKADAGSWEFSNLVPYWLDGYVNDSGSPVDPDDNNPNAKRTGNIKVYKGLSYTINPNGSLGQFDTYLYTLADKYVSKLGSSTTTVTYSVNQDGYLKISFRQPTDKTKVNQLTIANTIDNTLVLNGEVYHPLNCSVASRLGKVYSIDKIIQDFPSKSDDAYVTKKKALEDAQAELEAVIYAMKEALGDIYRLSAYKKDSYVQGDELKLYFDGLEMIGLIAKPKAKYSFQFLDTYGAVKETALGLMIRFNNDISINSAAHLIDTEIDVNRWAFIDKISKCYDQPWRTSIEINTDLTTAGEHSFADVLSNIANVAKNLGGEESLFARAAALTSSGKLAGLKLEGTIDANKLMITGASSTWYTDEKGNIVFVSGDGSSAMMLTGSGFSIANTKDKWGDWRWRTFGTGAGFTADEIVTGTLSAKLIEAGGITTDKLASTVGNELLISSNVALLLFATTDGTRPAGSLDTVGSYIKIAKDHIDVASSGKVNLTGNSELNLNGGNMNVKSGSNIEVESGGDITINDGGKFVITSLNFNIDASGNVALNGTVTAHAGQIAGFDIKERTDTAGNTIRYLSYRTGSPTDLTPGIYIGTDGVNFGGGKFQILSSGDNLSLTTVADNIHLGDTTLQSIFEDMNDATEHAQLTADGKPNVWRCTWDLLKTKDYKHKDIWYDSASDYGYSYVCNTTSPAKAKTDWSLIGTSVVGGAKLDIDAEAGTIDMVAANTININAGSTINIAANEYLSLVTNGELKIGNATSPFTIGANTTDSYIKYKKNSPTDDNDGIYLGTDGIGLGKDKFSVTKLGALKSTSGSIGGWTITLNKLYAGSNTNYVAMSTDVTGLNPYFMWVGNEDPTSQKVQFAVRRDGVVLLNNFAWQDNNDPSKIYHSSIFTDWYKVTRKPELTLTGTKEEGYKLKVKTGAGLSNEVSFEMGGAEVASITYLSTGYSDDHTKVIFNTSLFDKNGKQIGSTWTDQLVGTTLYAIGWRAAKEYISPVSGTTLTGSIEIPGTVKDTKGSMSVTMTKSAVPSHTLCWAFVNVDGTQVARLDITDIYDGGWTKAAKVVKPKAGTTSTGYITVPDPDDVEGNYDLGITSSTPTATDPNVILTCQGVNIAKIDVASLKPSTIDPTWDYDEDGVYNIKVNVKDSDGHNYPMPFTLTANEALTLGWNESAALFKVYAGTSEYGKIKVSTLGWNKTRDVTSYIYTDTTYSVDGNAYVEIDGIGNAQCFIGDWYAQGLLDAKPTKIVIERPLYDDKQYTFNAVASNEVNPRLYVLTDITLDASSAYNDGWLNAYDVISPVGGTTQLGVIKIPNRDAHKGTEELPTALNIGTKELDYPITVDVDGTIIMKGSGYSIYSDGWMDAADVIKPVAGTEATGNITIPNDERPGQTMPYSVTLTDSAVPSHTKDYAFCTIGGTIVARLDISRHYDGGWEKAAKVIKPKGGTGTTGFITIPDEEALGNVDLGVVTSLVDGTNPYVSLTCKSVLIARCPVNIKPDSALLTNITYLLDTKQYEMDIVVKRKGETVYTQKLATIGATAAYNHGWDQAYGKISPVAGTSMLGTIKIPNGTTHTGTEDLPMALTIGSKDDDYPIKVDVDGTITMQGNGYSIYSDGWMDAADTITPVSGTSETGTITIPDNERPGYTTGYDVETKEITVGGKSYVLVSCQGTPIARRLIVHLIPTRIDPTWDYDGDYVYNIKTNVKDSAGTNYPFPFTLTANDARDESYKVAAGKVSAVSGTASTGYIKVPDEDYGSSISLGVVGKYDTTGDPYVSMTCQGVVIAKVSCPLGTSHAVTAKYLYPSLGAQVTPSKKDFYTVTSGTTLYTGGGSYTAIGTSHTPKSYNYYTHNNTSNTLWNGAGAAGFYTSTGHAAKYFNYFTVPDKGSGVLYKGGSSYYATGTSYTPSPYTHYTVGSATVLYTGGGSYTAIGASHTPSSYTYWDVGSSTVLYTGGGGYTAIGTSYTPAAYTYYDVGSANVLYKAGTAVTPISGTGFVPSAYTYWDVSTSSTLYTGGGAYTAIGTPYTPAAYTYWDVGISNTLYKAGTAVTPISGTGYTPTAYTYYDVGSADALYDEGDSVTQIGTSYKPAFYSGYKVNYGTYYQAGDKTTAIKAGSGTSPTPYSYYTVTTAATLWTKSNSSATAVYPALKSGYSIASGTWYKSGDTVTKIGSQVTPAYYSGYSIGTSSTVYAAGSTVTAIGTAVRPTKRTGYSVGTASTLYTPGTAVYQIGTSVTPGKKTGYSISTGSTVYTAGAGGYARGTSVTPGKKTGYSVGTASTLYTAGTAVYQIGTSVTPGKKTGYSVGTSSTVYTAGATGYARGTSVTPGKKTGYSVGTDSVLYAAGATGYARGTSVTPSTETGYSVSYSSTLYAQGNEFFDRGTSVAITPVNGYHIDGLASGQYMYEKGASVVGRGTSVSATLQSGYSVGTSNTVYEAGADGFARGTSVTPSGVTLYSVPSTYAGKPLYEGHSYDTYYVAAGISASTTLYEKYSG